MTEVPEYAGWKWRGQVHAKLHYLHSHHIIHAAALRISERNVLSPILISKVTLCMGCACGFRSSTSICASSPSNLGTPDPRSDIDNGCYNIATTRLANGLAIDPH